NYSPFDGRYRADGGPIHATCTPDCRPIRKAPAQPNATSPTSAGARPNLTKREHSLMEHGKCRIGHGACVEGADAHRRAPLAPALCYRSTRAIWPPHATTSTAMTNSERLQSATLRP